VATSRDELRRIPLPGTSVNRTSEPRRALRGTVRRGGSILQPSRPRPHRAPHTTSVLPCWPGGGRSPMLRSRAKRPPGGTARAARKPTVLPARALRRRVPRLSPPTAPWGSPNCLRKVPKGRYAAAMRRVTTAGRAVTSDPSMPSSMRPRVPAANPINTGQRCFRKALQPRRLG
jgi:hypothetical protein